MSPFLDDIMADRPARTSPRDFKRLFVCIELPAYLRRVLTGLYEEQPGFRWVEEENLHLTLRFIGEIDSDLENTVVDALSEIHVKPFMLPVSGLGSYKVRGKPSVIWAGLGGGHPHLFQLQRKIENLLVGLGFRMERKAFHPHITLARTLHAHPQTVEKFLKRHRAFEAPPLRVQSFALYSSHLTPEGSIYQPELAWPLAA